MHSTCNEDCFKATVRVVITVTVVMTASPAEDTSQETATTRTALVTEKLFATLALCMIVIAVRVSFLVV